MKISLRHALLASLAAALGCGSAGPAADVGPMREGTLQSSPPEKGPAHASPLPTPGGPARLLDDDDTWRYVAPADAGRIYDALYFDGRFYVLHGIVESSLKVVVREINWLSASADGRTWDTTTLTETPFESYTRLASDGRSLLLAGNRHVAEWRERRAVPIARLEQDTAAPVLLASPDGYVIARKDDVLFMRRDGTLETTFERPLAQFRAGVYANGRFLLTGPFFAIGSSDGKSWKNVTAPCTDCNVVGLAYGSGRYLAADGERLFTSQTGERWETHTWQRATPQSSQPEDEQGEDRIARIDFTGGHFTLLTLGNNTSLSKDGLTWTSQLKVPLGQIGPAACGGRCVVAGGRLLLPPFVLREPDPPEGADVSAPYYCPYGGPEKSGCFECSGATIAECREGAICRRRCERDTDCPAAPGARATCVQTQIGGECMLYCDRGESCPSGMTCHGGTCLYVFDDPRCGDGLASTLGGRTRENAALRGLAPFVPGPTLGPSLRARSRSR